MGHPICFSSSSILRCEPLSTLEYELLIVPPALGLVFTTVLLVAVNRSHDGRRHYLIVLEGWIYFLLALLDMLTHILRPVFQSEQLFKALDITVGALSIVPPLCYIVFLYLLSDTHFIPLLPIRYQNPSKYSLLIHWPLIIVLNVLGSFLGTSYKQFTTHNHFNFTTLANFTLWNTITSLGLAALTAYQSLASSLVFYRLVRALLDQQRIEASALSPFTATAVIIPPSSIVRDSKLNLTNVRDNENGGGGGGGGGGGNARGNSNNEGAAETRLMNGIAWYTLGIHLGAIETAVGFADASFGCVVARRILRFISRACLTVGVVKGVDTLEDFQLVSNSNNNRPIKRRSTTREKLLISNPRHSTFRRLSHTAATAFQSALGNTNPNDGGPFYPFADEANAYGRANVGSAVARTPTTPLTPHLRPRARERVTVHLQSGQAPALEMRFSALDMPEAETIAQSVTSRPLSAIWFSSPFSLTFGFNSGQGSGAGNAGGGGRGGKARSEGWSLSPRSAPAWAAGGSEAWTGLNAGAATTTGYEYHQYQQYLIHGHAMGRRGGTNTPPIPTTPTSTKTGATAATVPGTKGLQNEALWLSGLRGPGKNDKGRGGRDTRRGKDKDAGSGSSGSSSSYGRRAKSVGSAPYPFAYNVQSMSHSQLAVNSAISKDTAHESYQSSKSGMSMSMMSWSVMNDFPPVPAVPGNVLEQYEERSTSRAGGKGPSVDPFNDPEHHLEPDDVDEAPISSLGHGTTASLNPSSSEEGGAHSNSIVHGFAIQQISRGLPAVARTMPSAWSVTSRPAYASSEGTSTPTHYAFSNGTQTPLTTEDGWGSNVSPQTQVAFFSSSPSRRHLVKPSLPAQDPADANISHPPSLSLPAPLDSPNTLGELADGYRDSLDLDTSARSMTSIDVRELRSNMHTRAQRTDSPTRVSWRTDSPHMQEEDWTYAREVQVSQAVRTLSGRRRATAGPLSPTTVAAAGLLSPPPQPFPRLSEEEAEMKEGEWQAEVKRPVGLDRGLSVGQVVQRNTPTPRMHHLTMRSVTLEEIGTTEPQDKAEWRMAHELDGRQSSEAL